MEAIWLPSGTYCGAFARNRRAIEAPTLAASQNLSSASSATMRGLLRPNWRPGLLPARRRSKAKRCHRGASKWHTWCLRQANARELPALRVRSGWDRARKPTRDLCLRLAEALARKFVEHHGVTSPGVEIEADPSQNHPSIAHAGSLDGSAGRGCRLEMPTVARNRPGSRHRQGMAFSSCTLGYSLWT